MTPGSGRFVRNGVASPGAAPEPAITGKDVTLNFDAASIAEVAKVILGDLLKRNYAIEPGVQGNVTLQTSRPMPRTALLPTLELVLRMNGAALLRSGALYRIVRRDQAPRAGVVPQLGGPGVPIGPGYALRIVPLRYVAAVEMQKILKPLARPDNIVRIDSVRNLLVLAGTEGELESLEETIRTFDVDWLAGMSMAMFKPSFVAARTLERELKDILHAEGKSKLDNLVRMVNIDRLNALIVVSARKAYVDRVAAWVRRLDREATGSGRRLFIYHVQNGKAAVLAEVLQRVFEPRGRRLAAVVAPGLQPAEIASKASGSPGATGPSPVATGAPPAAHRAAPRAARADGLSIGASAGIRIIADKVNNALLVLATAAQYKQVRAALRRLDIVPLQVLIEATIAEVSLTGELSQGLEWYLRNSIGNKRGAATLDLGAVGLSAIAPGFSYTITDSAGVVRAVLNTLASESRANIVSSPSLMVLNNRRASIQVGDQVPVTTQQQQATQANATLLNNIAFRDTGVLLTVTPRVNEGGLVTMRISQEVSNVAPGAASTLTPTIQQRKVSSTVAIQSGRTVVLGGLIRDNRSRQRDGIPGLHALPLVGWLFGGDDDQRSRTELVVLITPRVVANAAQAERITQEFRDKMQSLKPVNSGHAGAVQ